MNNSELVTYKLLSPNHSGKRTMETELDTLVKEKLDQK